MTSAPHTADPAGRLSPAVIVDRALALADAEGAEAVGMRRLARELGVTPMALYWHFRTKDVLLDAVADRVFAEVDLDRQPDDQGTAAGWLAEFERLVRAVLAVVRQHPAAPELLAGSRAPGRALLTVQEAALDVLRRGGLTPEQAANVTGHALSTVLGFVRAEPGRTRAGLPAEEEQRQFRAQLESLPPQEYPRTIEAAGPLSRCDDPDAYDDFGLALLLAGIQQLAESGTTP